MIRCSAAAVAVAIVVLVTGVIASSLLLVYVSIGVSVLAAVLLAAGAYLARQEIFGMAGAAEPAQPSAWPAGLPGEVMRVGSPASTGRGDEREPRVVRRTRGLAPGIPGGAPARPGRRGEHAVPNGNRAAPARNEMTGPRAMGKQRIPGDLRPGAPGRDRPVGPTLLGAGPSQEPGNKPGGTQDDARSRSPGKDAAPTVAAGAAGPSRANETAGPPKPKTGQPTTGQPATGTPIASTNPSTTTVSASTPGPGGEPQRAGLDPQAAAGGPEPPAAAAAEAPAGGTGGEPEPPAEDKTGPGGRVTIVPGVPRYHRRECILIRFLTDDDLETATRQAAKDSGCVPCKACQPDKVPTA